MENINIQMFFTEIKILKIAIDISLNSIKYLYLFKLNLKFKEPKF